MQSTHENRNNELSSFVQQEIARANPIDKWSGTPAETKWFWATFFTTNKEKNTNTPLSENAEKQ